MKIVCDSCEARYFVSDDKIQKRAVRLTCQKCGHVIIARRDGEPAAASDLRARLGLAGASDAAAPPRASGPPPMPTEPADWYYSSDGQSYGPFTQSVLRSQFAAGELGEECYVWHRSLGDWLPAHSTPPFEKLIVQAQRRASGADVQSAGNPLAQSEFADTRGAAQRAAEAARSAESATVPEVGKSSPSLSSLRDRLHAIETPSNHGEGSSQPEAATQVDAADDEQMVRQEVLPSADAIDLDVDGASRVISIDMLRGPAGQRLPFGDQTEVDESDLDASADPQPAGSQDLDVSLDLDVDGASRVVSLADIMAGAGKADAAPVQADDAAAANRPSWVPADLAAAAEAEVATQMEAHDGPVESSMLIHIDHLRQQNRRSKWYAIGGIAALVVLGAGLWLVIAFTQTDVETERKSGPGRALSARAGAEIDAAEFERLAPLEEFSMVDPDALMDGGDDEDDEDDEPATRPRIGEDDGGTQSAAAKPDRRRRIGEPTAPSRRADAAPSLSDLEVDDTTKEDVAETVGLSSAGSKEVASLKGRSDGGAGPSTGRRRSGRARIDLSDQTDGFDEVKTKRASKYTPGVSAAERNRFVSGLKKVSRSVMDCQRRHVDREGPLSAKKVYIRLTVEPDGSVSRVGMDKKVKGTYFAKCLDDVRGRWKFATFEGKPVQLRQGFVLE